MRKNPTYSVIVPVYNVENSIERCIESVLMQTFCDFELILIDDGSYDDSGIICEKYAQKDARIKVIHQKNQGVSKARNAGLDRAKGEYIIFIDSDDFVEKNYLHMFNSFSDDLILVGHGDYRNNKVEKIVMDENESWRIDSDEGIKQFLEKKSSIFVWGKRYRRSIIDEYNIRFRQEMKFSEDVIFNNDYILKAQTARNIKYVGYYYCLHDYETLSIIYERTPFIERTKWREIAYEQYRNHPIIQKIYVSQMLYFSEIEIIRLSNSNDRFYLRYKEVDKIIRNEFFNTCIHIMPEIFPKDILFFFKYKLIIFLLFKYKKKRKNNKCEIT